MHPVSNDRKITWMVFKFRNPVVPSRGSNMYPNADCVRETRSFDREVFGVCGEGTLVCLKDQPKDERPGMTVCLVGLSADCARKAKKSPSFAISSRTHRQSGMWPRCARTISTDAAKRLSRRSFEQLWRSVKFADLLPVIYTLCIAKVGPALDNVAGAQIY